MLIGEYRSRLTSGNRTALPKKFREALGENMIITRGFEGCIIVVSPKQWKKILSEAASGPFVSGSVRDTSRFLIGGAYEVALDRQGRFVIPSSLKEYANLSGEVCFLGLLRWVEIWSVDFWEKRKTYLARHSSEIAERLASIGEV